MFSSLTHRSLCEVMDVLTNIILVILSQYICASNYLKLHRIMCQLYLNKAENKSHQNGIQRKCTMS